MSNNQYPMTGQMQYSQMSNQMPGVILDTWDCSDREVDCFWVVS